MSHLVNFSVSPLLYFSLNKIRTERKEDFGYVAASAYHLISKEVENRIFKQKSIFRHTCMYKQPILIKYRNYNILVQILYSYLRNTDRLLHVFFLLLAVTLSGLYRKAR